MIFNFMSTNFVNRATFRALWILLCSLAAAQVMAEAVRFESPAARLPGPQLRNEAGFDLVDWNGDGRLDLVLSMGGMDNYVVQLNNGAGKEPKFDFGFLCPVNFTETVPQTIEHNQVMELADLDGDGLQDLIIFDGQLRMIRNTGRAFAANHWQLWGEAPNFFPASAEMIAENARYVTGPESMYWGKGIFPRQVLTLAVSDWDGDGLLDLIVCRFKGEAPGVETLGGEDYWGPFGRTVPNLPRRAAPAATPEYLQPLKVAPERGVYFYKNMGSKDKPLFAKGVELLTADGKSIAAPNPVVRDVDGDGVLDLVSGEVNYRANNFRVDWPTRPNVTWFRRPKADQPALVEVARDLVDAKSQPIPAGLKVRFADLRGAGVADLLVLDEAKGIRWYPNGAVAHKALALQAPKIVGGSDFTRFEFMLQPLIVDWFKPGSRDLLLHGCIDAHCKWALRRTALYRNTASSPGEIKYEFVGWINFQGDAAMVPQKAPFEDSPYDVYGSSISMVPEDLAKARKMVMSVSGRLYLFSDLAADGLTFRKRAPLEIANSGRNRMKGWQEIPVNVDFKVKYIRLSNDGNGMGNLRTGFLHLIRFEALAGGKNWATPADAVEVKKLNDGTVPWYQVQNPEAMFAPGEKLEDVPTPKMTSFGAFIGPAVVTLKEPVSLEKIRFLLSPREISAYIANLPSGIYLPFFWQGKAYYQGTEEGEPWYNYKVEVSADEKSWTTVADRMTTEMLRSAAVMTDWNGDGKVDLILSVLHGSGISPNRTEVRLYQNQGDNETPRFTTFEPLVDEAGKSLERRANWGAAYAAQCGIAVQDLDGDGRRDLVLEGIWGEGNRLIFYRNVSESPGGVRFARGKELGDLRTIDYEGRFRYFFCGDVDGDGIVDLLNSQSDEIMFFKGTSRAAPLGVTDLTAAGESGGGVKLQWTRPPGSSDYEIRWSAQGPIDETRWATATSVKGAYTADEKQLQRATLSGLPSGTEISVAVKSRNSAGNLSAISAVTTAPTAPLRRVVLRNGPASEDGTTAYQGVKVACLDGRTVDQVMPKDVLEVYSRNGKNPDARMILLRFRDLPAMGNLERATLALTTPDEPEKLQGVNRWATVACYAVGDGWDPATATYNHAKTGKPWGKDELEQSGVFQSHAAGTWTVDLRQTRTWDVTAAVRDALKAGSKELNLLLRVDYSGAYGNGQGYRLLGTEKTDPKYGPRLELLTK